MKPGLNGKDLKKITAKMKFMKLSGHIPVLFDRNWQN